MIYDLIVFVVVVVVFFLGEISFTATLVNPR